MPKMFLMRSLLFALILVSLLVPTLSFSAETSLAMDSMAGDSIGGGNFYFYPQAAGVFSAEKNAANGVSLIFHSPGYEHWWYLDFAAPNNALLGAGTYQGAVRFPFQGVNTPGMAVSGDSRGCNEVSGSFEVKEISYGQNSEIVAFWATFEQHCENRIPALRGEIRFNATAPNSVTTLKASANPSMPGQSVTFTARVAGAGGTPIGTVTFKDGATVLGTSTLSGNPATALLTTAALAEATHAITAEYSGDITFNPSTAALLNQKVEKAGDATTLQSSANPSVIGQSVTFSAQVSGAGGTPTGTVTFKDGATVMGTSTLSGNPARATLTTAALAVSTHAITAEYSGDGAFNPSTSAVLNQRVEKMAATALLVQSDNGDPIGRGSSYYYSLMDGTFAASVQYGGVTIVFDDFPEMGGNRWNLSFAAPGSAPLAVGTYAVGTYQGTGLDISNGFGCNQKSGSFEIKEIMYGPSNTILSFWATFEQHCECIQPALRGEIRYNATLSDTTVALTSSSNPSFLEQPVIFTAQVSSPSGTPTGMVAFMDGATVLGSSALFGNPATATLETAGLAAGTHPVKAVYSGGSIAPASESFAVYQTVKVRCGENIAFSPGSAVMLGAGGAIDVTVKASSCFWNVVSNAAWITLASSATGEGNGHVTLSVAANGSAAPRIGTVNIAGRIFTVAQSGSGGKWVDLGSLGGGDSDARGVSGDGGVVVGSSGALAEGWYRAFRWTKDGGFINLGTLPGTSGSVANGVSSDGNVIVGGSFPLSDSGRAFRWTQSAGMVDLGSLPGIPYAEAYSTSADGSVVVGVATDDNVLYKAFRWTAAEGMVDLGAPNYASSEAVGISADGKTVVGGLLNSTGNVRAFRWTESGGMTELGTLGGPVSYATGISGDGMTIVGFSQDASGQNMAFRWTAAEGMVPLNILLGGFLPDPVGISEDGKAVVGASNAIALYKTAIRWTQSTGMQTIAQWLTENGVAVANASFSSAYAASANGNTVVGEMENGHAYVATIDTDQHVLIAGAKGNGNGVLNSPSEGVSCSTSACIGSFAQDVTVVFTALASAGSTFVGWEGCSSVNGNQCTVLVNATKRVTATFTLSQYALTAHAEGNQPGTVLLNDFGIILSSPGSQNWTGVFGHGEVVTMKATTDYGAKVSWVGCDTIYGSMSTSYCTVTMDAPKDVTATFTYCATPGVPVITDPGSSVRSGSAYTVRWSAAAGANSYEVCEATNSGFAGAICTTVEDTSQSFTHTVGSNTVYYYQVRSKNTCGNASAFSATTADMAVYVDAEPDVRASVTCPATAKGGSPLNVSVILANKTCSTPFSFSTGRAMLLGNADGTLSGFGVYGPFSRTISPEAVVNGANCAVMPLAPATSPAKTLRVHDAVPAGLIGSAAQVMVELISSDNSVVVSGECMVPVVP